MSATLKVVHEPGVVMELRRGPLQIILDDQPVGSVKRHQTTETSIESGHHTIRVRTGRYSSQTQSFQATDNEVVTYRCNGSRIWPIYLASLVKPDLALTLKRE